MITLTARSTTVREGEDIEAELVLANETSQPVEYVEGNACFGSPFWGIFQGDRIVAPDSCSPARPTSYTRRALAPGESRAWVLLYRNRSCERPEVDDGPLPPGRYDLVAGVAVGVIGDDGGEQGVHLRVRVPLLIRSGTG